MKKFWFQMRMTSELKAALRMLSEKRGKSMTDLVGEILESEINKTEGERAVSKR